MTSPTSAPTNPRRPLLRRRGRGGFTLIELLVVIGILMVLMGILLPMAMGMWRTANRTKLKAELNTIAQGLEARKSDWGDYPRVQGLPNPNLNGYDGAVALCQALAMPADGDDLDDDNGDGNMTDAGETNDLGARKRPNGKLYPPYINTEQFRMVNPVNAASIDVATFVLLDGYDKPILYYPASPSKPVVTVTTTPAYVGDTDAFRWDFRDNRAAMPLAMLGLMIGDNNANGVRDADPDPNLTEVEVAGEFMLWSAGPDELYGAKPEDAVPRTGVADRYDAAKSDDVTNFR